MIETGRCILEHPTTEMAKEYLDFHLKNKKHLAPWDPKVPDGFFTLEYWEKKLISIIDENEEEESLRLVIKLKNDTSPIGFANYTNIERGPFNSCRLGYKIGEAYQGRGLMTEAIQGSSDYLFKEMGLHRIEANFIPRNKASGRVLEKSGFEKIGLAKNYLKINGRWEDHMLTQKINPSKGI